jgi:molybdate transport system substrate-binding protein
MHEHQQLRKHMNKRIASSVGISLTLLVSSWVSSANAADIKVISAGAVRAVISSMIEDYSKQTGHKFDFTVGTTGQLRNAISSGQHADLIITSGPLMGEIEKTGKLVPGSRADLGRVGMGVVVREGAPVPDVSTPEALKALLINAKSIAYTDPKLGGTSVIHLMNLAQRFGITDIVTKKGVLSAGGDDAAEKVAHGEAEIAVTIVSEIVPVHGAKLAAMLPGDTQSWTIYTSAIPASSKEPAHARAFINNLISPAMAQRWSTGGFEPAK